MKQINAASDAEQTAIGRALVKPRDQVRRFPPVLQFLTRSSPHIEREIRARSLECFRRGWRIEQICAEIHRAALENSFHATIGVQEVSSRSMPSFPDQTVLSALLIVDMHFDPDLHPLAGAGD